MQHFLADTRMLFRQTQDGGCRGPPQVAFFMSQIFHQYGKRRGLGQCNLREGERRSPANTRLRVSQLAKQSGDDFGLRTGKSYQLSRSPTLYGFAAVSETTEETEQDVCREREAVIQLCQSGKCGKAGGNIV